MVRCRSLRAVRGVMARNENEIEERGKPTTSISEHTSRKTTKIVKSSNNRLHGSYEAVGKQFQPLPTFL